MNSNIAEGKMKQFEGSIRKKWGKLSSKDLEQIKGDKDKLVGLIQEKYGEAKDVIEESLSELFDNKSFQETIDAAYEKKDEIVEYAQQVSENLSGKVKENPLSAILIGVGVGYILGKLMK